MLRTFHLITRLYKCLLTVYVAVLDLIVSGLLCHENANVIAFAITTFLHVLDGLFLEPINNQTTSDSSVVLTNLQCSPPFVSFLESCVVDTAQNDTCLDHSMDVVLHCGR